MSEIQKSTLVLAGLPGVGKTTLSNTLSEVIDTSIVSTDIVRNLISDNNPQLNQQETAAVYEECIKYAHDQIHSDTKVVIIDSTSLPKIGITNNLPQFVEHESKKVGRNVIKMSLTASPDFIINHNNERALAHTESEKYFEQLRATDELFSQNLPLGEGWSVIDVEQRLPESVARCALCLLSRNASCQNNHNKALSQIDYDLFHSDLLAKWHTETIGEIEQDTRFGRYEKYLSNCGIKNIYGKVLDAEHGSRLSQLFEHINNNVKDKNPFLPNSGTLLSNVTDFCEKIANGERMDGVTILNTSPPPLTGNTTMVSAKQFEVNKSVFRLLFIQYDDKIELIDIAPSDQCFVEENSKMESEYGALLLKPDAVKGGLLEKTIELIQRNAPAECKVMDIENVGRPTTEQIINMYEDLLFSGIDFKRIIDYVQSGDNVLITVRGNQNDKLTEPLQSIKGRKLTSWSDEKLLLNTQSRDTIRDYLPLPGDERIFDKVVSKIGNDRYNYVRNMNNSEIDYVYRTLAHSPHNSKELLALLKLSKNRELKKELLLWIMPN